MLFSIPDDSLGKRDGVTADSAKTAFRLSTLHIKNNTH